jgi:hypothetical protein
MPTMKPSPIVAAVGEKVSTMFIILDAASYGFGCQHYAMTTTLMPLQWYSSVYGNIDKYEHPCYGVKTCNSISYVS